MSKLYSVWTAEGIDEMAKWFEKGTVNTDKQSFETSAVCELRHAFSIFFLLCLS